MRILNPEIAESRRKSLLGWVIHQYIKTSRPIGSQIIAEEGKFKLSSASIRHILKELEEEGYLSQSHPSSGRVPTDKGYRFYVDYLMDVQRLAVQEKMRIQKEYESRTEELDHLLLHTSRMLSLLSHSAGLALSPNLKSHSVLRMELIPLATQHLLAVLVTESGFVRHWPLKLSHEIPAPRLAALNRFLNQAVSGRNFQEVQDFLCERIEQMEKEFHEMAGITQDLLREASRYLKPEELYVEGVSQIVSGGDANGFNELRAVLEVVEKKKKLTQLLQKHMKEHSRKVRVSIGSEHDIPELKSFSLVTSTYQLESYPVGLVGILGPKHMEYSKMVALVDSVSQALSQSLKRWENYWKEYDQAKVEDERSDHGKGRAGDL